MLRINQFNLEPGVYDCHGVKVVLVEVITHEDNGIELIELEDPYCVFRDLNPKADKIQLTMMRKSIFTTNYHKA